MRKKLRQLALVGSLVPLAIAASGGGSGVSRIHLATYRFDPVVEGIPKLPEGLTSRAPSPTTTTTTYLIQLHGPVTSSKRAIVERSAEILGYLPENAFLVRAAQPMIKSLNRQAAVRWSGLWQPAFKLAPDLVSLASNGTAEGSTKELLVWAAGDLEKIRSELKGVGARVLDTYRPKTGHRIAIEVSQDRLDDLARLDSVLWIERKLAFEFANQTTSWVAQSNVPEYRPIWDRGVTGTGQIAAVMDSGLDINSCWFRDPAHPIGPTHRKVVGYKYSWVEDPSCQDHDGDSSGCPSQGHGTHVAGTLAGNRKPIDSSDEGNGVALNAKLFIQDLEGSDGNPGDPPICPCETHEPVSLQPLFDVAYVTGARVNSISLALGGVPPPYYDTYSSDVDEFMLDHPGFLIVVAAGNVGTPMSVGVPGQAKNCATVGATLQYNGVTQQECMADYSSRGPTFDQRRKPTVVLPGGQATTPPGIFSASSNAAVSCTLSEKQGTSMATPAVSGAAILARQYLTDGFYPTGIGGGSPWMEPSGALLKGLLIASARDIGAAHCASNSPIPNDAEGWGRVVLDDALYFAGDPLELRIEESGVATGDVRTFFYDVQAGQPLKVVLTWTDHPALLGSTSALVNNLDLGIRRFDGVVYKGNVFVGGESTTGGSSDAHNVEEVFLLKDPPAGRYRITVSGSNVPMAAPQTFALVTTGAFANWP